MVGAGGATVANDGGTTDVVAGAGAETLGADKFDAAGIAGTAAALASDGPLAAGCAGRVATGADAMDA